MTYTYPNNDYQNPKHIRALLGSVWTNIYEGQGLIDAIVRARADIEQQSHDSLKEAEACVSRNTIPLYQTRRWYKLAIRESDLNSTTASLWRFNDADLPDLDGSPAYRFDYPLASTEYMWELPADVVDISAITNRITDPSVILTKNLDFRILPDRSGLAFRDNPFADVLHGQTDIFENGEIVDSEITLWLCCVEIDRELLYTHFGYVLGLRIATSEAYKQLINGIMDAIVGGTAMQQVQAVYAALTDIPVVIDPVESVEAVSADALYTLIITDKHVYKFNPTVTVDVVVGDIVYGGQSLVEDFVSLVPARGESHASLPGITLGKGMLDNIFTGELGFANATATVDVTGAVDSERVEWELNGHPLDVDLFWDTVHANRLTYSQSLYALLQEYYGTVPTTINPMEFLLAHVLRNNTVIFIAKAAAFGTNALGLGASATLRRIIPPHVTILFVLELPGLTDCVTMDNVDDADLDTYTGMEPLDDEITEANTETYVKCKHVSFTCH